jgi:hypothetical protein
MSQSEQLKLQPSAATKAEGEQRSEGGKICDHAEGDGGYAEISRISARFGVLSSHTCFNSLPPLLTEQHAIVLMRTRQLSRA